MDNEKNAPTAKDALNICEEVLLRFDNESSRLWDILTALRGPDSGDFLMKRDTTVQVRRKAFPIVAAHERADYAIADFSFESDITDEDIISLSQLGGDHFQCHIAQAVASLKSIRFGDEDKS